MEYEVVYTTSGGVRDQYNMTVGTEEELLGRLPEVRERARQSFGDVPILDSIQLKK